MKKRLILALLILLSIFPVVFALGQADGEIVLPRGENGTLSLPLFSRTYVRVYEGSMINFNLVDPDTDEVLIENRLIIKEVGSNYSNILLSVEGSEYEEVTLSLGEDHQINFTYKDVPFMLLKEMISHYNATDATDRNIVLFFNVPFMKKGNSNNNGPVVNTSRVAGTTTEEGLDFWNTILIIVIIVLVVAIVYSFYKKSKKSKHH